MQPCGAQEQAVDSSHNWIFIKHRQPQKTALKHAPAHQTPAPSSTTSSTLRIAASCGSCGYLSASSTHARTPSAYSASAGHGWLGSILQRKITGGCELGRVAHAAAAAAAAALLPVGQPLVLAGDICHVPGLEGVRRCIPGAGGQLLRGVEVRRDGLLQRARLSSGTSLHPPLSSVSASRWRPSKRAVTSRPHTRRSHAPRPAQPPRE